MCGYHGTPTSFLLMLALKDCPGGEASKVRGSGETQGEGKALFLLAIIFYTPSLTLEWSLDPLTCDLPFRVILLMVGTMKASLLSILK